MWTYACLRGSPLRSVVTLAGALCACEPGGGPQTPPDMDRVPDMAPQQQPNDLALLRARSGWQIFTGGTYRYGPSIVIDGGTVHMWTCSPGTNNAWDYIRYRHSEDGGLTWSSDQVVLRPTAGSKDALAACDPGVIRIGESWYLAYTSTEDNRGTANELYVARANGPSGPFEKWNGKGWGGNPEPIVRYSGEPAQYGIGEPSLVLHQGRLYVYYTNIDRTNLTDVATVEAPVGEDWPARLKQRGHAITRRAIEDSTDIKYVDALGRFIGVATVDRFGPNAGVAVYQSFDGLTFEPAPFKGTRLQHGAHNMGISGTPDGHVDTGAMNFIAYAYQPPGNTWGNWPTYLQPVQLSTTARGETVWGAASSIRGQGTGMDMTPGEWLWSAPRAWDGDPETAYSSRSNAAATTEEWVFVDLGRAYRVGGAVLTPRRGGAGFPVDFSLQTSLDADAWTDVPGEAQTGFQNPGDAPVARTFGKPVMARYLRLRATRLAQAEAGAYALQLAELAATLLP